MLFADSVAKTLNGAVIPETKFKYMVIKTLCHAVTTITMSLEITELNKNAVACNSRLLLRLAGLGDAQISGHDITKYTNILSITTKHELGEICRH
jgi:hypothetical protein